MTLSTALINTLGVATWYLFGIAYTSLASRFWPKLESMRGKWGPWDVLAEIDTNAELRGLRVIPEALRPFMINMAFFMFLTIWPIAIYNHAKRGFRTKKDTT